MSRAVFWLMVLVLVSAFDVRGVRGHDHGVDQQWMRELGAIRGLCCDGSDALKIEDPDWIITDKGIDPDGKPCVPNTPVASMGMNLTPRYCVRLRIYPHDEQSPMAWYLVTEDAVVRSKKADGIVRVWPITTSMRGDKETVLGIRCFLEGSGA